MENQFVTYNIASWLNKLGFTEDCLATFHKEFKTIIPIYSVFSDQDVIKAPLWQQAIRWFGDLHFIYININKEVVGSDEWDFSYTIEYLPRVKQDVKRRSIEFKTINSFKDGMSSYIGAWHKYEEAQEQAILMAIELLINQK